MERRRERGVAMGRRGGEAGKGFHEAPLVLFSALAVAGAGIGGSRLLLAATGQGAWASSPWEAGVVAGLLALGVLVSILHLGRPHRAGLVLRMVGRSALTAEVLALGASLVVGAMAALLPPDSAVGGLARVLLPWLSVLVLLTLGTVYRLPGQVGWGGSAFLRPLALGMVFGMVVQGAAGSWAVGGSALAGLLLVWVVDALLMVLGGRKLERGLGSAEPSHPVVFRRRRLLLAIRFSLVNLVAPLALLLAWTLLLVVVLVASGVLLDRFLFYALAARLTTEGEVRRVEAALHRRNIAPQSSGD
jgi:DMSO reductase anchor subunit